MIPRVTVAGLFGALRRIPDGLPSIQRVAFLVMKPGCIAARGAAFLALAAFLVIPSVARSHCDSLDGPVVRDARIALEAGDVTPVLKWVRQEHEAEIRDVFARATTVRALGDDART